MLAKLFCAAWGRQETGYGNKGLFGFGNMAVKLDFWHKEGMT